MKRINLIFFFQALLYNRTLDDLDSWIDDVELQLQSEDHGRDLTSVQNLLKKHQRLEADISAHASEIEQTKDVAHSLARSDHFMSDEILEKVALVAKRLVKFTLTFFFGTH